jgi:hypothetical protein
MLSLCDFHVHSNFSDGRMSIREVVDAYGRRGFGAIAITDHITDSRSLLGRMARLLRWTLTPVTFPEYLETIRVEGERAWRKYGMRVIPGFELTLNDISDHRSGHVVALGVEEFFWADGDVLDWTRRIRDLGGVSVAAHPVHLGQAGKQTYLLWNRRRELAGELDAWEVASGRILFDPVAGSGLPMIASSDLHKPEQMSSWKTVLRCERHPEAILRAIVRQEVSFQYYADVEPERLGDATDPLTRTVAAPGRGGLEAA